MTGGAGCKGEKLRVDFTEVWQGWLEGAQLHATPAPSCSYCGPALSGPPCWSPSGGCPRNYGSRVQERAGTAGRTPTLHSPGKDHWKQRRRLISVLYIPAPNRLLDSGLTCTPKMRACICVCLCVCFGEVSWGSSRRRQCTLTQ